MKSTLTAFTFLIASAVAVSCNKKKSSEINCDELRQGLLERNADKVKSALQDQLGYQNYEGFQDFTNEITRNCGIEIPYDCYSCLESLPPQSVLVLSFTSDSGTVQRSVTILESSENKKVLSVE